MYDGPSRMPTASTAARAASTTASVSCVDGQTCARATPNAGGSAVSLSVTVSGTNRPSCENALTVSSGPSTSCSTSAVPERDSARAAASAGSSSARERTSLRPRWPCRSGALTTHGSDVSDLTGIERPRVRDAGCGERLALAGLRRREGTGLRVDRMVQADPSGDPRRDPYRPIRAGGDDPVDPPRAGEPVDPLLVLRREHRASSASRKPGALASRSTAITSTSPRTRAASSRPSWAGPAPRTRRRGRAPGSPATRPRCRGTRQSCARGRP